VIVQTPCTELKTKANMKKRADAESRVKELEANIDRLQREKNALMGSQDLEAAEGNCPLEDAANKRAAQTKKNGCSRFLAKLHMILLLLCGKKSVS
jgi:hypothetical protein